MKNIESILWLENPTKILNTCKTKVPTYYDMILWALGNHLGLWVTSKMSSDNLISFYKSGFIKNQFKHISYTTYKNTCNEKWGVWQQYNGRTFGASGVFWDEWGMDVGCKTILNLR